MIPTNEPEKLTAGDSWKWRREDLSDYLASVWTLTYQFANADHSFTISATADSDAFAVSVTPATTATYKAGRYKWAAFVTDGVDRYKVDEGSLDVEANFADAAKFDSRSHARRVLDAVEAVIEGRATKDQESYSIGGRSLSRTPLSELLNLRNQYRAEWFREQNAERAANGRGFSSSVKVRF